jgi:SAM-dependent methyltransferase
MLLSAMRAQASLANKNLQIYNSTEVAAHYAGLNQITPCERLLFERHIPPGAAVLDLGVGGGRTTPYLSQRSSKYLGVDVAMEMVRVCQSKFPNLEFKAGDASNLSGIASGSFDALVGAFNVLDYVIGTERRLQCWEECHRVLKPGGVLIFSSHNPRAVVVRPDWNRERVRQMSMRVAGEGGRVGRWMHAAFNCGAALLATVRAVWSTFRRLLRQSRYAAFWRGSGYVLDPAHGGLLTHCQIPTVAIAELERHDFRFVKVLGDDYPRRSGRYWTEWYYYVFQKPVR